MADISTITLSNGKTYNIKDAVARSIQGGAIAIKGTTTTVLTDNATTNPITISGSSYTALPNDAVFYGNKEFVFDGTKWHEFGDMSGLGDLAKKSSATGNYTPEGTVSQPTFSGEQMTSTGNFTPSGTVSAPTISIKTAGATTNVNSITDVGTLPSLSITVDEETENMAISFNAGTLPTKGETITVKTGDAAYESSAPSFSGSSGAVSVTGTPAGTVTAPTFSGTPATITVS